MKYEIVWLVEALSELEAIKSYIEQDNPSAATKLIDQLLKRVRQLAEMPGMGHVDEEVSEFRNTVVRPNYNIFYRVEEKTRTVFIAHIWHSARSKKGL